jgi:hypothetical protein
MRTSFRIMDGYSYVLGVNCISFCLNFVCLHPLCLLAKL